MTVESAREMYQTGIGAHVNQSGYQCVCLIDIAKMIPLVVPRGQLPAALVGNEHLDKSWEALGMTPSSYSPGPCFLNPRVLSLN